MPEFQISAPPRRSQRLGGEETKLVITAETPRPQKKTQRKIELRPYPAVDLR
jgi:hypothetical protein